VVAFPAKGDNRKQSCEVVKLRLKNHDNEEVEISALNCLTICSPLPSKVKVDYPHLEGLQLADSLDDSYGTIDILIGTDHYWDVVTGETVRGDSGPTAVSSKFGWLLSGALRESVIACADSVSSNLIISGDCSFVPHPPPRKTRIGKHLREIPKILGNRSRPLEFMGQRTIFVNLRRTL